MLEAGQLEKLSDCSGEVPLEDENMVCFASDFYSNNYKAAACSLRPN